MERRVHGRTRDPEKGDERFSDPIDACCGHPLTAARRGAQWTGITTRLAERLLETNAVDAVLTMAPDEEDRWRRCRFSSPRPKAWALPRHADGLYTVACSFGTGSGPGLQALGCDRYPLSGLRVAGDRSALGPGTVVRHRNAVFGQHDHRELPHIPRVVEQRSRPHHLSRVSCRLSGRVAIRRQDPARDPVPAIADFQTPGRFLSTDVPHLVDYTNTLADITVGYMGGEGEQWVLARNARGEETWTYLATR